MAYFYRLIRFTRLIRQTQLAEQTIVRRIRMPSVLTEGFAAFDTEFLAAMRAPAFAAVEVLVDAVLLQQPVPLAGVTGEHLLFQLERG